MTSAPCQPLSLTIKSLQRRKIESPEGLHLNVLLLCVLWWWVEPNVQSLVEWSQGATVILGPPITFTLCATLSILSKLLNVFWSPKRRNSLKFLSEMFIKYTCLRFYIFTVDEKRTLIEMFSCNSITVKRHGNRPFTIQGYEKQNNDTVM